MVWNRRAGKPGWFAVTIAGFVSVMVVIISALSGADMGGFFGVVGSLIKWATFVFIPLYILFSVPAAIDFFREKHKSTIISNVLFVPAALGTAFLTSIWIGIPVFRWIVHDIAKEVTSRGMEALRGECLLAAMVTAMLPMLYFCGRADSLGRWLTGLGCAAAAGIAGSMIPRIGTCLTFGAAALLLIGFLSKAGGGESSCDYSYSSSYSADSSSSSATDDYHRMQDLVRNVHRAGGSRGLTGDEYELYKEAVQNGSFSGRDLEYMANGMAENNTDRKYTNSDYQVMEDADRLWN